MKRNHYIYLGLFILVFIIAPLGYYFYAENSPSQLDGFATCLKTKGVIFYGAFWCPHCQATKKMFGSSAHLLPYVECSTPDGNDQTLICKQKGISSYPTWMFPDGNTLTGERTLQELATASGCALPGGTAESSVSNNAATVVATTTTQ